VVGGILDGLSRQDEPPRQHEGGAKEADGYRARFKVHHH
jgi:hypothetical protein